MFPASKISEKGKKRLIFFLISLNAAVAAIIVILIFHYTKTAHDFDSKLEAADSLIFRGLYPDGKRAVKKLIPHARKSADGLKLLKRAKNISAGEADNSFFIFTASEIYGKFRNDRSVRYCYFYSLMLGGRYDELEKYKKDPLFLKNRELSEAAVAGAVLNGADPKAESPKEGMLKAFLEKGRFDDDRALSLEAYRFYGDVRFLINYMASQAFYGNIAEAYEVFDDNFSGSENEKINELGVFLALDAGEYEKALDILNKKKDKELSDRLVEGDLLIRTGKLEEAYALYKKIIAEDDDFSFVPYINSAWLGSELGQGGGEEIMADGLEIFKEEKGFFRRYCLYLYQTGKENYAASLLERYLSENSDPEMEMIYLFITAPKAAEEKRYSFLWDIVNSASADSRIYGYFASLLFKNSKFDELRQLLEKTEDKEIVYLYSALMAVNRRDYEAAGSFMKELPVSSVWQYSFDMGLLKLLLRDYYEAALFFEDASEMAGEGKAEAEEISNIYLWLGISYYFSGNIRGSSEMLDTALKYDSSNFQVLFFKEKYKIE